MSATRTKLDRAASVEAQALAAVRQLLAELGGSRGLEELAARGAKAHLERELGLGSLERVELMVRLGNVCGVRLPDRVMAEADTVNDLIEALLRENPGAGRSTNSFLTDSITAGESPETLSHRAERVADLEQQIRRAESLTEILRLRGLGEPARAHIQLYEEDERLHTITFGELYSRASAVAAELQQRGLEPSQTVAIMLPTCAEFFYTFAGTLLAGGIPVPIYPPFRADHIAEYARRQASILRNAESRFLITFRQAEGLAHLLRPQVPTLREVLNAERLAGSSAEQEAHPGEWRPVENLSHRARGDDIAFLQYTSGSTGDPKGVILTHANLLANIRSIVEGVDLQPEDVAVSWLPLYHDMGLIGAWFVPLFSGNPLVAMSPLAFLSRPERWLRAIHRHHGTISPAPNFAYELCVRKIAETDLQGLDLSSWRAAFNGAETVHADTIERFAARFAKYGFRREALLPVYGLAEATLGVSAARAGSGYKVDAIERDAFESEGRAIPAAAGDSTRLQFVGAGKPFLGVEVRIVASDGQDAGERVEGRLWFRSLSATTGYYRNAEATRELIREPGWLDSGDRAYRADGEIYITGRAKDLIIKAGRNLYPHEIEDIAGRVAGVRSGCVVAFGAPDARSGTEKLIVAAEVRNRESAERIGGEITRAVHDSMGVPPDLVELLPPHSIPKTSSGKLRRSETRRLYLAGELGKKIAPPWLQMARLAARSAAPLTWELVKHGANGAVRFLYGVYALAAFAAVFIPMWLLSMIMPPGRRVALLLHRATRLMLFVAGVRLSLMGAEVLAEMHKSGPWIFASNHSSYVDIVVTLALLPADVRFVAKGEVLAMPFFGTIARRSGHFAFDRGDPQARIRQAEEVDAALSRGESVAIYPEGTFTATVGIRPFQLGVFRAAVDTQRPICPVAVRGARQILKDGTYLPRPGRVTVTFGPLIAPDPAAGDDWREIVRLRDATREIIARNVGEPLL
ncbi:MAG TPA: AMP-binding protein [Candidatus Acidoferrales bacterium]|nr:AMP-binding protein [Candidatus Acidoferrales bacterium]